MRNCGLSVTGPCPAKFVRIVVVTVVVSQHLLVLLAFVMAMLQLGSPGGGVVFLVFSRTFFPASSLLLEKLFTGESPGLGRGRWPHPSQGSLQGGW